MKTPPSLSAYNPPWLPIASEAVTWHFRPGFPATFSPPSLLWPVLSSPPTSLTHIPRGLLHAVPSFSKRLCPPRTVLVPTLAVHWAFTFCSPNWTWALQLKVHLSHQGTFHHGLAGFSAACPVLVRRAFSLIRLMNNDETDPWKRSSVQGVVTSFPTGHKCFGGK